MGERGAAGHPGPGPLAARRAPRLPVTLWAALLALLVAPGPSWSEHHEKPPAAAFRSDQAQLQVISALVGGKNVFIPATLVAVAGTTTSLSIYNTTGTIHGFAIEGLGIEEVLQPGEEHEVALPKLEGGRVYRIHCQLHGAHRAATLVVLPGE